MLLGRAGAPLQKLLVFVSPAYPATFYRRKVSGSSKVTSNLKNNTSDRGRRPWAKSNSFATWFFSSQIHENSELLHFWSFCFKGRPLRCQPLVMPAGEHSLPSGPKLLSVPEAPVFREIIGNSDIATSIEKAARRCFDVSPFQVEIWTIWRCLYIQNRYVFHRFISVISQLIINITIYIIIGRSDTKLFIPSNTGSIHPPL